MLYNPKWSKSSGIVGWLARQPSEQTYDYRDNYNCLYAKYLRSRGVFAGVSPRRYLGLLWGVIPVWGTVPIEVNAALRERPWTFGAAEVRMRMRNL